MNNITWKLNINLPKIWFNTAEFDKLKKIIDNSLSIFLDNFQLCNPSGILRFHEFGTNEFHVLKILSLFTTEADWRDKNTDYTEIKNQSEVNRIKVVATIETTYKQKQSFLIDDPLEFELAGKLIRSKKTNEIYNILFTTLYVSTDIQKLPIIKLYE